MLLWGLGCSTGPHSVEDIVGVTWVFSDLKSEHFWPSWKLFNILLVPGCDVRAPLAVVLWVPGGSSGGQNVQCGMAVLAVLSDSKSEHYWPSQKLFNVFKVAGCDVRAQLAVLLWVPGGSSGGQNVQCGRAVLAVLSDLESEHYWPSHTR